MRVDEVVTVFTAWYVSTPSSVIWYRYDPLEQPKVVTVGELEDVVRPANSTDPLGTDPLDEVKLMGLPSCDPVPQSSVAEAELAESGGRFAGARVSVVLVRSSV